MSYCFFFIRFSISCIAIGLFSMLLKRSCMNLASKSDPSLIPLAVEVKPLKVILSSGGT